MRYAILLLLACLSGTALAEERTAAFESSYGPTTIVLSDQPCTNEGILAAIKSDFHSQFQAGRVSAPDITRELCWALPPETGEVFLVDDTLEIGSIPLSVFVAGKQSI